MLCSIQSRPGPQVGQACSPIRCLLVPPVIIMKRVGINNLDVDFQISRSIQPTSSKLIKHAQVLFHKGTKAFRWGKDMVLDRCVTLNPSLTLYQTSQWNGDLNVKPNAYRRKRRLLGLGEEFLDTKQKTQPIRTRSDELDPFRTKNFQSLRRCEENEQRRETRGRSR